MSIITILMKTGALQMYINTYEYIDIIKIIHKQLTNSVELSTAREATSYAAIW
jgi:hypothetical protein